MKVRQMTRCALFGALLVVCGWLSIPVGDGAVSMQSFGVLLCLGVLGGKWGTVTVLVYLALGGIGLPVFTGFRGGLGVLLGPTGGYLWGFLLAGLLYWILEKYFRMEICMLAAMVLCYACGTAWYALVYTPESFWLVAAKCVLPYLLPDTLKLLLALTLTKRFTPHPL